MTERGITQSDFKSLHPSGKIGAKLSSIEDVMHTEDEIPLANQNIQINDALLIMTQKRFGCVGLTDSSGNLIGIITDGDLRRFLSGNILEKTAKSIMTRDPITISGDLLVSDAIAIMNDKKITCLFIVDGKIPIGIVHLHDLLHISAI